MWRLVAAISVQGTSSAIGIWRCIPPPVRINWPIATSTQIHYSLYTFGSCPPNRYQGPPWNLASSWISDWSGRVVSLHNCAWKVCHRRMLLRMNSTWNNLQVGWMDSSKCQHPPCMMYRQNFGGKQICDFETMPWMTSDHRLPEQLGLSCLNPIQILVQERSSSFQNLGRRDMHS